MTWTYNPASIADTPLYQVRFLIGDTLPKDPQLSDEELGFALSLRSSIYGAAAESCRALAAQMSRQADSTQGSLHTLYSSRARAYAMRAAEFEVKAMARSAALPYSGQTSRSDYRLADGDEDRIAGQFFIGMDDDETPVGSVDPEHGALR